MAGGTLGTIRGTIAIDYDGKGIIKAEKDIDKIKGTGISTQQGLDRTGRAAGLAGLAIAGGFAVAVAATIKFDKQLSGIQAVSNATGAQMDLLRSKALKLGADTAFSASDAASAMEELVKAGISVEDVLNGAADATVALAAAGGISLPEAATIAANAMNQFRLSAQELPHITDLIAGAANASAIDVGQLGQSMSQVGAVAHLAGLSFNDTAVAIAEMGNAGIKGSDAGTSLKTFLQNLIPTTKQQIEVSKKLGLITKDGGNAFFDASGKVKSLADVSQVLQNALRGQSKEQQLATLQTLFGSDAIRAAAVLADQGAAGFNTLAAAIGKTSAADVARTRMGNLAGQFEQLKGSAETLAIQIGSRLIPFLNTLATNATRLVNWFTSLSSSQQKWAAISIGTVGAVLLLASALIRIVSFVRALIATFKALQAAWILLNASFLFSPIGLIILAIVALVAVFVILWLKFAGFRNFWIGAWNGIKIAALAVGSWFAGPFANFFISAWNTIVAAFNVIKGPVMAVINFVVQGVIGWWTIIRAVLGFFAPLFQAVFGLIAAVVRTAFTIMGAMFAVFKALAIDPLIAGVKFLWQVFMLYFNFIRAVVVAVFGFLSPYIQNIWNFIVGFLRGVWNGIVAFATFSFNRTVAVISGVWNTVKSVVVSSWNFIVGIIQGAVNRVIAVINGIKVIVSAIGRFFGELKNAASGGVGSLISFVAGIPGRVLGALGNLASLLFDAGKRIIQGLIDGIKNMAGNVKNAVSNVLQSARNLLPFSPAKEGPFSGRGWTRFSGQSMVEDLAAGIEDRRRLLTGALSTTLAGVTTPITVTGVSGPLRPSVGASPVPALARPPIVQNFNVPSPMGPQEVATYAARRLMLGLNGGATNA